MLIDHLPPITTDRFWDYPLKIVLASLLICLIAPIEIPIGASLPVTCQTLIILTLAMILGANCGAIATGLYLFAGAIGLPVFAQGRSGVEILFGPTGGFLFSFVIAAWIVGKMAEGAWGRKWYNIMFAQLTGQAIILTIGFIWLGFFVGFDGIFERIYPLLPAVRLKIGIATLLILGANALMKVLIRHRHSWE
ncbi:MAG: biotin transporter BioY [Bacteroidota bacterium]